MRQLISLLTIAAFATAAAATSLPAQPSGKASARDPNEKVCETALVVGSRLAKKKTCLTRAEWADRQLADQKALKEMGAAQRNTPCASNPSAGEVAC